MVRQEIQLHNNKIHVVIIVSAIVATFFLFYIDEGYYDFRWMRDIGNWFVFLLYVCILTTAQEIVYFTISKITKAPYTKVLVVIGGIALGVWACFQIFTSI